MSFESVDSEGRQVDAHPIARDGAYVNRDGTIWHYPLRGLAGKGAVAGRGVDCLTAEASSRSMRISRGSTRCSRTSRRTASASSARACRSSTAGRRGRTSPGELPYPAVDHLLAALEPAAAPPRLMHGDLTGNVLFHESLPPAIIDFAPYYRPPQYASAIVVADALCWEEAPAELADAVGRQYLLRALIYRAVTSFEFGGDAARELEVAFSLAA